VELGGEQKESYNRQSHTTNSMMKGLSSKLLRKLYKEAAFQKRDTIVSHHNLLAFRALNCFSFQHKCKAFSRLLE